MFRDKQAQLCDQSHRCKVIGESERKTHSTEGYAKEVRYPNWTHGLRHKKLVKKSLKGCSKKE